MRNKDASRKINHKWEGHYKYGERREAENTPVTLDMGDVDVEDNPSYLALKTNGT